jgi:threonine/homoserine/homoserine lactone efflux protein
MAAQLMEFALASLVIIVIPGPDLVLLLRNATTGGRAGAAATALGIMIGNGVLAAAAAVGLTALVAGSESLYTAIRIAGAAYLVYLGVSSLIEFFRHSRLRAGEEESTHPAPSSSPAPVGTAHPVSPREHFRQGLMSNLLNPKVATFYLSLFPQFELPGLPTLHQHVLLAGLFWALALVWYIGVVTALGAVERLLRRQHIRRGISGVAGVTLVALGAVLAVNG